MVGIGLACRLRDGKPLSLMKLEEIKSGQSLTGIEANQTVSVVAVVPLAEGATQLVYRTPDGAIKERLLSRGDEASVHVATLERPFSFDGDGAAFQLACEAKRIDLAFLFDPMMAVHSSNIDPLPHQITAVYESLLPRQPLRFVLADDPGERAAIPPSGPRRREISRLSSRPRPRGAANPTRTAYRKFNRHDPKTTHGRAGANPHALPLLPSLATTTTLSRIVVTQ